MPRVELAQTVWEGIVSRPFDAFNGETMDGEYFFQSAVCKDTAMLPARRVRWRNIVVNRERVADLEALPGHIG